MVTTELLVGAGEIAAPALSPTEAVVARVWAVELGLDRVGLDEDFIDLGANSLQGLAIIARLEATFGLSIPVRVLFEEPTVADLAAWVDRRIGLAADTAPVRLQAGSGRPLFAVPGGRGETRQLYGLAKLARAAATHQPVYGFPGDLPAPPLTAEDEWVQAGAATLVAGMRALQPKGPYLLLGVCIGGVFAWEMTRQLEADGDVARLFLVDTRNPRLQVGDHVFHRAVTAAMSRDERRERRQKRRGQRRRQQVEGTARPIHGTDRQGDSRRVLMARSYAPAPIAAPVTLLVNELWHRVSPDLGWSDVIPNRLRVVVLSGGHGPGWNESEIAAALRAWLQEDDPTAVGWPPCQMSNYAARG